MSTKVIAIGEIMMRLSPPGYRRFSQADSFDMIFGGGEANVCVSLANYGFDTEFVTRLANNDLGETVIKNLRKHNVGVRHIQRGGERLGIYFIEKGAVNRGSKVIYDRAHSSFSTVKPGTFDWPLVFDGADWFHWSGITPAVSHDAAKTCLEAVTAAKDQGLGISVDLNYRSKLWQYGKSASEIMPDLVKYCDLLIANEEDAAKIFGIHAEGVEVDRGELKGDAYKPVAEQLMLRFPNLKRVAFTLRGSVNASENIWAGVLWDGVTFHHSKVYRITDIVDRVGGGDAFAGGLIYGLLTYRDNKKALDFATAASALKHTIEGDFNLVTVDEVEKLMQGNASGRVSR